MTLSDSKEIEEIVSKLEAKCNYAENDQWAIDIFRWLHDPVHLRHLENWYSNVLLHDVFRMHERVIRVLEDFFLSEKDVLTFGTYQQLINYSNRIKYFFYLSETGSTEKIKTELRKRSMYLEKGRKVFSNKSDAYKLFLLLDPFSSEDTSDVISFMKVKMSPLFRIVIHFLTHRVTSSRLVYSNKLSMIRQFVRQNLRIPENFQLSNVHLLWAMSSYMDSGTNFQLKIKITDLLDQWIARRLGTHEPVTKNLMLEFKEKPTLLVMAENMELEHVMYRCFSIPLSYLKDYFHVIAYTAEEDRGSGKWEWCDELVTFQLTSFTLNIETDRIQKINPDVVVYPSIGLKVWALLFSRLRLAPLQISLLGHPDFPYSERIDYVIGGNALIKQGNEKHIRLQKTPGSLFSLLDDRIFPKYTIRENPEVIRIGICANIFKLTHVFMEACQEIREGVTRKIEFHIFQNLKGIHFQLGQKQIKEMLGEEQRVYPAMQSKRYFRILGECDLYLSPFPFGGENSLLDALIMRLPVVSLIGNEPRERLDYRVLQTVGLKETAVDTREKYVKKAIDFIENDLERVRVSRLLSEMNISQIFREEAKVCNRELAGVIRDLYDKKIQE